MTRTPTRPAKAARTRAERLARMQAKRPQFDHYDIVLDPGPVQAAVAAQQAVERAQLIGSDDLAVLKRDRDNARAAAEDAVERLHLLGLPRAVFEQLQVLHPPTEEQKAKKETYDLEAFLPALIAATVVENPDDAPVLTLDDVDGYKPDVVLPGRLMSAAEVDALLKPWNQAEVGYLWGKALAVCTQARNPSLPFASGRTGG